jgi:hypothetical protein
MLCKTMLSRTGLIEVRCLVGLVGFVTNFALVTHLPPSRLSRAGQQPGPDKAILLASATLCRSRALLGKQKGFLNGLVGSRISGAGMSLPTTAFENPPFFVLMASLTRRREHRFGLLVILVSCFGAISELFGEFGGWSGM